MRYVPSARRGPIRIAIAAALAAGLLLAAYALGHSRGAPDADDEAVVVDCVQRVESLDKWPPEGWEARSVIAGPVALYGARDAAREEPDGDGISTEIPVLVDAEQQVTLTARSDDVRLGFGDEEADSRAVTFKACPAFEHAFGTNRKVGPFTQFVGTFSADEPTCVELDAHVFGEEDARRIRFGLGKEC